MSEKQVFTDTDGQDCVNQPQQTPATFRRRLDLRAINIPPSTRDIPVGGS